VHDLEDLNRERLRPRKTAAAANGLNETNSMDYLAAQAPECYFRHCQNSFLPRFRPGHFFALGAEARLIVVDKIHAADFVPG
jgi:hypothetical protein